VQQLERGGRRINQRTDGGKHTFAVYEIIDTETMESERIVLNETRGDDMHQFDSLLTVEQAMTGGSLSQTDLDEIELNIWRKRKCSEMDQWEGDINYFVQNAPNDMFLMVPVRYVFKRQESVGTLVKYYSRDYSSRRCVYGSKQTASILLEDGKLIDVKPENIISVTSEAMPSLLSKYADGVLLATTPSFDLSNLFPYTDVDEKTADDIADKLGAQASSKIQGRQIILQRMRAGIADNLDRKGSHLSDEERERIIHRMMISYFGEDVQSIGIH